MKKILVPPLAPVVIFVLVCLFAAIADRVSAPTVINDHADNAPRRAIFGLGLMTPIVYLFFVMINAIDSVIQRVTPSFPWFSATVVTVGLGIFSTWILFSPTIDKPHHLLPIAYCSFVGAALMVVPMSLWRRRIRTSRNAEPGASD